VHSATIPATAARSPTGTVQEALALASTWLARQPALAIAQARAVLEAVPGYPQARLIEARGLRRTGELAAARALLGALAAEQPRSAATALELGLAAHELGEAALAIESLSRATTLKPGLAAAWTGLAAALREAGRDGDAAQAELAAIRAATTDAVLLRAATALTEGRPEQAEPLLRDRLRRDPADVAATRLLAELAWRIGRMDDAITLLRRTLQLAPAFESAREFLTRLLAQGNQLDEAIAQAAQLVEQAPLNPGHAMLHASLMVRVGDIAGARAIYDRLVGLDARQPRVWMNLGHVLKTLGEQEASVAAYRRAISLSPALGEAWWSLANLKTVKLGAGDIAAMQAAVAGIAVEEDAWHLHFALGKALEDQGDFAAAFGHYEQGNRLRRAHLPYDADETHRDALAHAAAFTREVVAGAGGGCQAPDPIFVLGMPRAGSTLIEQILASHSAIEGTMELPEMMMIAARLHTRLDKGEFPDLAALVAALPPAERTRLGEEYLERTRIHRKSGRPLFIDKMPNNWQHVGLIHLLLPRARIIDARRHPMACCFSGWKQHFARGQAFSYGLADIGRYYRDYVEQMAAFDAAAPGVVHRVIYEDMVADTPGEVRRMLDWLGLEFEPACLAFWENRRAVRTASSEQVRRPIFTDGLDHWQHFAPWLQPLSEALGPALEGWRGPAHWAAASP
jgi:tetratricopeptide (TPR) repeat protein